MHGKQEDCTFQLSPMQGLAYLPPPHLFHLVYRNILLEVWRDRLSTRARPHMPLQPQTIMRTSYDRAWDVPSISISFSCAMSRSESPTAASTTSNKKRREGSERVSFTLQWYGRTCFLTVTNIGNFDTSLSCVKSRILMGDKSRRNLTWCMQLSNRRQRVCPSSRANTSSCKSHGSNHSGFDILPSPS